MSDTPPMSHNNPIPGTRGADNQIAVSTTQNTTDTAVVLNRSGSMEVVADDAIGGCNAIIFLVASQDASTSATHLSIPEADPDTFTSHSAGSCSGLDAMDGIVRLKRRKGRAARIRRPRSALPASPRPSRGPGGGQSSRLDRPSDFPGPPQRRPASGRGGSDEHHTPQPPRSKKPKSTMSHPEIIPEESVTLERLGQLFQQAFYRFELDENEGLTVETDGPSVLLTIHQDHHLLKFRSLYGFKSFAPADEKLAFVNRCDDSVIFARFSLPEGHPDVLVADYYLPFVQGAPAHQIVNTLRLFSRIVPAAINRCDEEDLLE